MALTCFISCSVSIFTILGVAINRWVCIARPSLYNRLFTRTRTIACLAATWLLAAGLDLPNLVGWGNHIYDRKTLLCLWNRLEDLRINILLFIVIIVTPTTATAVFYALILKHVNESSRRLKSHTQSSTGMNCGQRIYRRLRLKLFRSEALEESASMTKYWANEEGRSEQASLTHFEMNTNQENMQEGIPQKEESNSGANVLLLQRQSNQRRNQIRLALTMFIIYATFVTCWSVYSICTVFDLFDTFPMELHAFGLTLGHFNSCLNPWLYGLLNKGFRKAYQKILSNLLRRDKGSNTNSSSRLMNAPKSSLASG
ncbi:unnamed protein product [Protopolystoma xenopodis]|uniref:G-protein coupled receptors family 1 profile domain-containing protein n=1 Tax=Protopolystoma xenopodis TaxID=117903 RepID=A0A3S5FFM8_9PLAT|nr:unnamed protein product [Protopolystoma xenopodis]